MATLIELAGINQEPGFTVLKERIKIAIVKKATNVAAEVGLEENRRAWAAGAISNPMEATDGLVWGVIADNAGASIDFILNDVTDAQVEAAVGALVDDVYKNVVVV